MNVDFAHLFVLGGVARLACVYQTQALRSTPCPSQKSAANSPFLIISTGC
ncbi:MAG: hypothetical protein PHQ12_00880 [Chthoniobacteraceae bacterium]|nr:hypothetical protein [Chthoniobacteraceae bacterium]